MGPKRKLAKAKYPISSKRRAVNSQALVVACAILTALGIQLAVPFVANTSCGLIIPHDHVLVGGADENDLAAHEAAEAACAAGRPAAPDQQASDLHGSKGQVVNVIHLDQNANTQLVTTGTLLASLPTPTAFQQPRWLYSRLDKLHSPGQSIAIPPPKPPPESLLHIS